MNIIVNIQEITNPLINYTCKNKTIIGFRTLGQISKGWKRAMEFYHKDIIGISFTERIILKNVQPAYIKRIKDRDQYMPYETTGLNKALKTLTDIFNLNYNTSSYEDIEFCIEQIMLRDRKLHATKHNRNNMDARITFIEFQYSYPFILFLKLAIQHQDSKVKSKILNFHVPRLLSHYEQENDESKSALLSFSNNSIKPTLLTT